MLTKALAPPCLCALICLITLSCIPGQEPQFTEKNEPSFPNPTLPTSLSFAGEAVPLDDPDVAERLDRELTALSYFHASTLLVLKRSKRWKKFLITRLEQSEIPPDFFYLAVAESSLSPTAVSSAQAVGMWQLMPVTATELGLEVSRYVDQRRDPERATQAACQYLRKAYTRLENWTLVAASYNRGTQGISNALSGQGVDSYYDLYLHPQTYRYLFKVLAYKLILENPDAYGFSLERVDPKLFEAHSFRELTISESISSLPQWAQAHNSTYKYLKLLNPWIITPDYSLPVAAGTSYTIKLPVEN